jgi:hypothetical protein
MTVGELIGFAIPAIVGYAAFAVGFSENVIWSLVIIAGAGEGAVLGYAQWLALRRYLPNLSRNAWVLATTLAAIIAYALALLMTTLGERLASADPGMMILAFGVIGLAFVLTMGGAQWFVLRKHLRGAGWWIPANAIAWPLGVLIPVLTITLVPDASPALYFIFAGILGGVLMGLAVGCITGIAVVWLLRKNALL